MTTMNYIGLDVHKKTISYCVKDVSGRIQQEGKIGSTRRELDCWMFLRHSDPPQATGSMTNEQSRDCS